MNRSLLAQVRQHIAAGADVDMATWHCGTTACIGGWAVRLAGFSLKSSRRSFFEWLAGEAPLQFCEIAEEPVWVWSAAQALLGLTDDQADGLFYVANWPADLQLAYAIAEQARDQHALRAVVLERIDRMLGTTTDAIASYVRAVAANAPPKDSPALPSGR